MFRPIPIFLRFVFVAFMLTLISWFSTDVYAQSEELQSASQTLLSFKGQLTTLALMSREIIREINAMQVSIKAAHGFMVHRKPQFLIEQAILNAIDENIFIYGFKLPTLQSFLDEQIIPAAEGLTEDEFIDVLVENEELTTLQANSIKQKLEEVNSIVNFILDSLLIDELIAKLSSDAAQSASGDCTSADDPADCTSIEGALNAALELVQGDDNETADGFLSRARVIAREFLREMRQLEKKRAEILKRIRSVCVILDRAIAAVSDESMHFSALASAIPQGTMKILSLNGREISLRLTKRMPNGVYFSLVPIRDSMGQILGQKLHKFVVAR
jgi:hypothetical protein